MQTSTVRLERCSFVMMALSCRCIVSGHARPTIALCLSAALLDGTERSSQQFANGIRSGRNFCLRAAPVFDLRKDGSL
jgi:hypothetical protein